MGAGSHGGGYQRGEAEGAEKRGADFNTEITESTEKIRQRGFFGWKMRRGLGGLVLVAVSGGGLGRSVRRAEGRSGPLKSKRDDVALYQNLERRRSATLATLVAPAPSEHKSEDKCLNKCGDELMW